MYILDDISILCLNMMYMICNIKIIEIIYKDNNIILL